jgi:nucleoid DNA-binding protein
LISEKEEYPKTHVNKILNSFFEIVQQKVVNDEVSVRLNKFGSFVTKHRPERHGVNALTKKELHVSASKTMKFSPSPTMSVKK